MKDKLWAVVLLVVLLVYGPFLIVQSQLDVWPSPQFHATCQLFGGISMVLWGARYFIRGPRAVIWGINIFVITTLAGLCCLIPVLVVRAI